VEEVDEDVRRKSPQIRERWVAGAGTGVEGV
jgi:hypothetical protein